MANWTHEELCERARRWLRGTRRCNPVYSKHASCAEIPDAIGWSSAYRWYGSTVIECKVSISDFRADKKKRFRWAHVDQQQRTKISRITEEQALASGYIKQEIPLMGDYRFYMSEPHIIGVELIDKHAPDHGLLHVIGNTVRIIRDSKRRELVDKDSEIRYLRFAIINKK